MASARPRMPVPPGELTPQELCDRIRAWAERQGYEFDLRAHATEYGVVTVRDPQGGFTISSVPNAHHGRRIRRDQVRYVIHKLNTRWKD